MASTAVEVFTHVFSCCLSRRGSRRDLVNGQIEPDEESRLIPALPESTSGAVPDALIIQQRMKERMGSIVRAKEGKMVNVTARLPFNLHGRSTSSKSYSHSYSRQDSRSMSPSSASASASAERSSRPPNAPVHSPSPLSVTTTPQKPPHSRARIHGHVGAPLGMSPISSPVVPTQAPTGMYANGNGNGNGHEHDQCRSPSRDPSSESTSASHSKSGSGSGSRKDDYEPSAGGRGGQMFGVRLVRGLPRSRASTAGPGTGPGRDLGTTTLATGEEGETGVEGAVANGRGRPLRKASESDEVEDTAAGAASPSPAAADKAGSTAAPPSTQTSMPMIITIPAPLATAVPIPVPEFKLKDTGPLVISWD